MRFIDKTNSRTFGRRAFTLAELLIVVAIIAVLVGISIPIFNAQLEKSREATDIANMRSAKAAAVQIYYEGINKDNASDYGFTYWESNGSQEQKSNAWAVYDGNTGTFITAPKYDQLRNKLTAYGQGTTADGGTSFNGYGNKLDYTNAVILVTIYPDGAGTKGNAAITKYGYPASMGDVPCVILEWRNTTKNNSFIGRGGKNYGVVVFLE